MRSSAFIYYIIIIPSFIEDWTTHLVYSQIANHERFSKILRNAVNLIEECILHFFFIECGILECIRIFDDYCTYECTLCKNKDCWMGMHYFFHLRNNWNGNSLFFKINFLDTNILLWYTYSKINVKRFILRVSWITRQNEKYINSLLTLHNYYSRKIKKNV